MIVPTGNGVVIASDLLAIRPFTSAAWVLESQQPVTNTSSISNSSGVNPAANTPPFASPVPGAIGTAGTPTAGALGTPVIQPNNPAMPLNGGAVPQLAPTLQLPPDVQSRLNPVQLELLNKLHLETKLNAEYTYILAEQSGWNYEVAIKGFQSSLNNLPREAFIQ